MNANDRRSDQNSSDILVEALKIQRAFDQNSAIKFLDTRGVNSTITSAVLSNRYDRRMSFRRKNIRQGLE